MSAAAGVGLGHTPGVERWLTRILIACLVVTLVVFAAVCVATMIYPYGVVYGEALPVDQARRILAGLPVYRPTLDEAPYVIDVYPPVYPAVVAAAGAISGLPLLQLGRAVSILAALAAGLLVGLFALRLTGSRLSGLAAAALLLGNPLVSVWAPLARIDTLALALSLAALWILYQHWRSWLWLAVAAALLVAAVYTRQTYILAAPLAGTIWLWHNERRRALVFAGLLAGACGLVFLLLNAVSHGGFYLNAVVANLGPYDLLRLLLALAILMAVWPITLVLAGVEIAQAVRNRARQSPAVRPFRAPFLRYGLVPYSACAFLSALTAGKVGSDANYLLEAAAALSIWAGGALAWQPERQGRGKAAMAALVLLQVAWALALCARFGAGLATRWADLPRYDEIYRQVQAAANQGPILTDTCLEMVLRAGHGVYFEPFAYEQARREGLWQPDRLIREIETHKFPLVVLDRSNDVQYALRWSEPITQAIEESYEGTEQVGGLIIFTPRQGSGSGDGQIP